MSFFDGLAAVLDHLSLHLISILELSNGIKHKIQAHFILFLRALPPHTCILHYSREAKEFRMQRVIAVYITF